MAYFIIRPDRSGFENTDLNGMSVSTVMGCTWKYGLSHLAAMITVSVNFSSFVYLCFGPYNAWLT